jgi:amino acid adenylation domain-containing protein
MAKPQKSFKLSFAQKRLWLLDRLEPDTPRYNIYTAFRLEGNLRLAAFTASLVEIVRRHESLRTVFQEQHGRPTQQIHDAGGLRVLLADISGLPISAAEREAFQQIQRESQRSFDLANGPLLRAILIRLTVEHHLFLVTMHHIVSDGWSIGIFFNELSVLYESFSLGKSSPLPELAIQYVDFAIWQRDWLSGERLDKELAYWRQQLAGLPPVLDLPTDRPRPPVLSGRGAVHDFCVEKDALLSAIARQNRTTLFVVALGLFNVLLARYSGRTDLVVGVPTANRTRIEIEGLIGFFVNTLVLRSDLAGSPTFGELVRRVAEVSLQAFAHQELPFDKLVEALQPGRHLAHTPLFQVMFSVQNAPGEDLELHGLEVVPVTLEGTTAKFELTLSIMETASGLMGGIEYSTDLFDAATIQRLARHLATLAGAVTAASSLGIDDLEILTPAERWQAVGEWADSAASYPRGCSLKQLFEAQVEKTPNAVAVRFDGRVLAYRELNAQANWLAHRLRSVGVGPDVPVAMFMERSFETVAALVAIMKAGGAYLALDLQSPRERLAFILDDARPRMLLAQRRLLPLLPPCEASMLCLEDGDLAGSDEANPPNLCLPSNLHSVVYTSGSTGVPKGSLTTVDNYVDLLDWYCRFSKHTAETRSLLATGLNFDANFRNAFSALLAGGCTVLAANGPYDADGLLNTFTSEGVTVITCPPSFIHPLIDLAAQHDFGALSSLRYLHLGGEPLVSRKFRSWLRSRNCNCTISNCYGLTETSDFSTSHVCTGEELMIGETASVGAPRQNHRIYICDRHGRLLPIGVPGEVYVGGLGVTRGFLNRPGVTAERFVPDPFHPGERLYRTGDLARWQVDGRLRFVGRVDHQVKVRGLRIELGEIEAALRQHDAVREAVATVNDVGSEDRRLVAYVSTKAGRVVAAAELREYSQARLAEFMIPAAFVILEEMPLNASGKIDRQRLPAVDWGRSLSAREYVAPRNRMEQILVALHAELLGLDQVGVKDNFFELGGHSLLAVQLMSRMRKALSVDLPLQSFFRAQNIAELARLLSEGQAPSTTDIQQVSRDADLAESVLVEMAGEAGDPQLFLMHPVGGQVSCYRRLAALLVPGMVVRGLRSMEPEHLPQKVSMDEMTAIYLASVRKVQPQGPYFVAGWSMGGLLAFELARKLRADGHEVRLVLIDPTAPQALPQTRDVPLLLWLFTERFGVFAGPTGEKFSIPLEEIRLLDTLEDQLNYLVLRARMARALPAGLDKAELGRLFATFMRNIQALEDYQPTRSPGGATLILPHDGPADRDAVWLPLFEGRVCVGRISGDHFSCLQPPHVELLARELKAALGVAMGAAGVDGFPKAATYQGSGFARPGQGGGQS